MIYGYIEHKKPDGNTEVLNEISQPGSTKTEANDRGKTMRVYLNSLKYAYDAAEAKSEKVRPQRRSTRSGLDALFED